MDWTQTFTIILTNLGGMAGVWYAFYRILKEDIKETREESQRFRTETREESQRFRVETREESQRFRADVQEEFQCFRTESQLFRTETREEFAKVHALWATLLQEIRTIERETKQIYKEIYEIKLSYPWKSHRRRSQ